MANGPANLKPTGLGIAQSVSYLKTLDSGIYLERNRVIVDHIAACGPRRVLELAAAHPQRAMMLLKRCAGIELYEWSDWSEVAVEFARPLLAGDPRARVSRLDATLPETWSGDWDVILCDSIEHLPNDIEILSAVRRGVRVFLSMPNWRGKTHCRSYGSEKWIRDRYTGLLDFKWIEAFPWPTKKGKTMTVFLGEAVRT